MYKGMNPDKAWELRMEILLCTITSLIYLIWGVVFNYSYSTGSKQTPYTYAWTFTSSTINNTITSTQRHVQPIVIGAVSEENYSAYEGWFTVFPFVVMLFVGLMKMFATCAENINEKYPDAVPSGGPKYERIAEKATEAAVMGISATIAPAGYDTTTQKRRTKGEDAEKGFGDAMKGLGNAADGLTDSSDSIYATGRLRYGTLFFPMFAATGLVYMVAGACWFPVVMYHLGHDSIAARNMFVCGSVIMGAGLIIVEGGTHLVWTGKTKTNPTISVIAWICLFLSSFLTCAAGATIGNVIMNQEGIWNNPLTGSDAAFTSVTVYPLAALTRYLFSGNTMDFYNALLDAKILVWYFYSAQAVRIMRLATLLIMEALSPELEKRKADREKRQSSSEPLASMWWWTMVIKIADFVIRLGLFAEAVVMAGLICHGDFSIISGQFKMPPLRTKVL